MLNQKTKIKVQFEKYIENKKNVFKIENFCLFFNIIEFYYFMNFCVIKIGFNYKICKEPTLMPFENCCTVELP